MSRQPRPPLPELLAVRRRLVRMATGLEAWATLLSGRSAALRSDTGSAGAVDPGALAAALSAALTADAPDPAAPAARADRASAAQDTLARAERILFACRRVHLDARVVWPVTASARNRSARVALAERCSHVAADATRLARMARRSVHDLGDLAAELIAAEPELAVPGQGTPDHVTETERLMDALLACADEGKGETARSRGGMVEGET